MPDFPRCQTCGKRADEHNARHPFMSLGGMTSPDKAISDHYKAENERLRALLREWLEAEEPWLHPQDELVGATRAALEVSDG